jgi:hypothetical protein
VFAPHIATSAARTTGVATGGDPVTIMKRESPSRKHLAYMSKCTACVVAREVDIGPMIRQVQTRRRRTPPLPVKLASDWPPNHRSTRSKIAHSLLGRARACYVIPRWVAHRPFGLLVERPEDHRQKKRSSLRAAAREPPRLGSDALTTDPPRSFAAQVARVVSSREYRRPSRPPLHGPKDRGSARVPTSREPPPNHSQNGSSPSATNPARSAATQVHDASSRTR